jgi:DNA-binding XRE family transcriptional regulator
MPASLRRHNLARLREELSISQTTLAAWIGRSWSAIKAIETGKLELSSRLATLISATTGVDRNWLLRNDLAEPMPPLEPRSGRLAPGEMAYAVTLTVCALAFERLCGALRLLKPGPAKEMALGVFRQLLDSTIQLEYQRDSTSMPSPSFSVAAVEYFTSHPEGFDRELVSLLNSGYLLASVHQRARMEEAAAQLLARKETAKPRRRKEHSPARKSPQRRDPDNAT